MDGVVVVAVQGDVKAEEILEEVVGAMFGIVVIKLERNPRRRMKIPLQIKRRRMRNGRKPLAS